MVNELVESQLVLLVPVLNRPGNAAPLVASIKAATTVPHRILFICSRRDADEIAACEETGAEILIAPWGPGRGDFARKINLGYRETSEPWLFQGADDLRFHARWDIEALAVARRFHAGVIGTNDLANPSVLRGKSSTHSLIVRSYIEEYGGTLDGSGEVFCERFSHQFVDLELVETAKFHKQFAFAARSIVEHRHPHWGTAEMDDTYRKGQRDTRADRALYVRRAKTLWARRQVRVRR